MKVSRFNTFVDVKGTSDILAYNALRQSLCLLNPQIVEELENESTERLEAIEPTLLEQLKIGGFIVKSGFDEIKFLEHQQHQSQYSNSSLSLTIAPTINCNLACPYCFESHKKGKMSPEVIEGIEAFVENYFKTKHIESLSVTWYGGEPLLYPEVIKQLAPKLIALCKQNNAEYTSDIITNGTKYTKENAEMLKENLVSSVQITIDGDKHTHDCRRVNKGGGGSFDQIMKNVEASIGIIPITVRINVDKGNVAFGERAFQSFKDMPWFNSEHLNFYYGWVREFTGHVKGVTGLTLDPSTYHEESESFREMLSQHGYTNQDLPTPNTTCVATNTNGFVIGPTGEFWKCWSVIGDEEQCFGSVFDEISINDSYLEYMEESWVQDEECRNCEALPICMGGCSDVRLNRNKGRIDHKDCGVWRYAMKEKLRKHYERTYLDDTSVEPTEVEEDLPFLVPVDV